MWMRMLEFAPEEEAAACEYFNKGLFPKCRGKNDPYTCFACFFLKANQYRSDTWKCFISSFAIMIAAYAASAFLGGNALPGPVRAAAVAAAGAVPFGWKAVRRILPQKLLELPGAGRAVCFFVELALSALTGWAAAVVRVYRTFRIYRTLNKIHAAAQIK